MWSTARTDIEAPTIVIERPRADLIRYGPPTSIREYPEFHDLNQRPIQPVQIRNEPPTTASRYLAPPHETVIPLIAPLTVTGWAFSNLARWIRTVVPRTHVYAWPAEDV